MIKIGSLLKIIYLILGCASLNLFYWVVVEAKEESVRVESYIEDYEPTAVGEKIKVGLGEMLKLVIKVESSSSQNISEPQLPSSMIGFELQPGPPQTQSESVATFFGQGGQFQSQQTLYFKYDIRALQKGEFILPRIKVSVENKDYYTKTIPIVVTQNKERSQRKNPNPTDDSFDQMDQMDSLFNQLLQRRIRPRDQQMENINLEDSFFIKAEVDKQKAYVGEQITASWYLYTRAQIHDIDTLKYPALKGFWKEEIELATRLNFQQQVVNGVVYHRALLASYALFPLSPGTAVIDAYEAKCTVSSPSFFGFNRPQKIVKSSKTISVDVKEVPTQNRPGDYKGAVGQFSASAQLDESTVVAHQPLNLKIRFEGRGNAKMLDLPSLHLPPNLEIYDSKSEAKFFREGTSFKQFNVVLIPRQAGKLEIPAITLHAFNPNTEKFYEVLTQPIALNVLPGTGQTVGSSLSLKSAESVKPKLELTLPGAILSWQPPSVGIQSWVIWGISFLLVLLMFGGLFLREWYSLGFQKDLSKVIHKKMNRIKQKMNQADWRSVGADSTNLVYLILGEISGQGGANQELDKILLATPPSLRRELAQPLSELLKSFELLSFAPEEMVGNLKNTENLAKLIKQLESVLIRALKLMEKDKTSNSK
ncbi:MAG: BatD family protein [Bdellovibrionales bacterium]|nr:BatD family protein [Bdellovibrionales bacterium]